MNEKHYAEVLIDGKVYTLGGIEEAQYLQRVAGYINEKTNQMKRQEGFMKQSQEYQAVMISLNIADDYFKATNRAAVSERQRDEMERESYGLKHELVTTQLRLENVTRDLEEKKEELLRLKKELEKAQEELMRVKAVQAAAGEAPADRNNGRRGDRV